MTQKERYRALIQYFIKHQPDADTELVYQKPYELIVAVMLSAQCTDKRVNLTTPAFFKQFPDFKSLANANFEAVFRLIKSITYPNSKSHHLIAMAKMVENDFQGALPSDVNQLQKLPGVGRKTANVLASVLFNLPTMAVDTHVFRVSARIGLSYRAKTPLQCELQLVKHFPKAIIPRAHHWLILHGRYVCTARNPHCMKCGLKDICKFYQKSKQNIK